MILYCSGKLQKVLDRICLRDPDPPDPLDGWYANTISLEGKDAVVAMLPTFRFCVLLPDIQDFQWASLNRQLVQAIRAALGTPEYAVPQEVIDRYLPEDTVFQLRASNSHGSALLSSMGRKIREMDALHEPAEIQDKINTDFNFGESGEIGVPCLDLAMALRRKYEPPVQAIKLKISLNLGVYEARRVLLVSQSTTFLHLHDCLQEAYRWADNSPHRFELPAEKHRPLPVRVLDEDTELPSPSPEEKTVRDKDALLLDYLQEGDTFRYCYGDKGQWQISLRFTMYVPHPAADLPACTLREGSSPPEAVGDVSRFQALYRAIQTPRDPNHDLAVAWADRSWHCYDNAASITSELHRLPLYWKNDS